MTQEKIPTRGVSGHAIVPDEVVAGLKWCAEQGMTYPTIRILYPGIEPNYFVRIRDGTSRIHILPKCPPFISEHSWKERYRWPSTVKD